MKLEKLINLIYLFTLNKKNEDKSNGDGGINLTFYTFLNLFPNLIHVKIHIFKGTLAHYVISWKVCFLILLFNHTNQNSRRVFVK